MEDLVFIGETGFTTNRVRLYGRAAQGQRALGTEPCGHWKRLTLIGAISLQAEPVAMTIDSGTDNAVFLSFVEQIRVPSLRPGQIVLMDNLAPHKTDAVRSAIEAAGCSACFLPRYSPEWNPIEACWSKMKALIRKIGARSVEALQAAIRDVLAQITESDLRGWYQHCGYAARGN